ncbi:DNA (cytosine-5-)-methyltransferase [Luteolibacter luteus]|uniref:DNA (cytosine-5-)-methyltransferase n=1 Tax=Luteolibacter luteus TaxID=2728835 RepID=UPI0023F7F395|nr:DNA (cytosine-5-)-methyltransferase [Luteolibacter luteus]
MAKKDPFSIEFGQKVRQLREDKGISQEQLAFSSGLHRTYIGGVERAERNPTIQQAARLAKALGVEVAELFDDISALPAAKSETEEVAVEVKPTRASRLREEPSPRRKLRFIDLFCGIGGFRYAFEKAGCECVFSSDWDKHSQVTYQANFGEKPHGDIHAVAEADIPKFDILCGGFPCQPFSLAGVSKKNSLGRKHGFDDEKQGNLFFKIAEILDYHRPQAFVLENVKNLKSHDKGRTFEIIHETLTKHLGYTVYTKIIDGAAFVPQHRERIFLIGFKPRRDFEFPEFPKSGPKLSSILEKNVPEKYTLTDHLWNYLQNYAEKHRAAGNGFGFGLVTGNDVTRTLSARYHKDGSEILVSQGKNKNPRRLTPRECARLMGYPDEMVIPVSDTQAYRQFGNSVVVPVVEKLAESVVQTLRRPANQPLDLVLRDSATDSPLAKLERTKTNYRPKK